MKKILIIFLVVFITSFTYLDKEPWDYDKSKWSPLMLAVYYNDLSKVKTLIIEQEDLIAYRINKAWTLDALVIAIKKNNLSIVKVLIATDEFNQNFDVYFHLTCRQKNALVVGYFIEQGADVNQYSENGHSHLMSACMSGTVDIVECLISNGAEINHQRKVDGMTALMYATLNGNVDTVELMISYGVDKDIKNWNNNKAYDYIESIKKDVIITEKEKLNLEFLLK